MIIIIIMLVVVCINKDGKLLTTFEMFIYNRTIRWLNILSQNIFEIPSTRHLYVYLSIFITKLKITLTNCSDKTYNSIRSDCSKNSSFDLFVIHCPDNGVSHPWNWNTDCVKKNLLDFWENISGLYTEITPCNSIELYVKSL